MPAIVIEDELLVPDGIDDFASFRAWTHRPDFPRSGRIDFIDKRIVIDRSPEELFTHGRLKTEFIHAFAKLMHGDRNLMVFSDSTRVASQEAALSSEPDVVVVSRKRIRSGELRLIPKSNRDNRFVELDGGPDIAVEIVSDSSVQKDATLLPASHHKAGTLEYWLVDARNESDIRFIIHRRGNDGWIVDPEGPQRSDVLNLQAKLSATIDEDHWPEFSLDLLHNE